MRVAGNIVDRLQHSSVVDFIDFATIWPNVFNVGDIAITLGSIMLISSVFNGRSRACRASRT